MPLLSWDEPLSTTPKATASTVAPEDAPGKGGALGSLGESIGEPFAKGAKHVAKQGLAAVYQDFLGHVFDTVKAAGGEPLPISAVRLFMGPEVADGMAFKYGPLLSPYAMSRAHDREQAALAGKLDSIKPGRYSYENMKELTDLSGANDPAPGAGSKIIGGAVRTVANPLNWTPIGGKPIFNPQTGVEALHASMSAPRQGLMLAGAGGGAEAGGMAGGSAAANLVGEEYRDLGHAVGSVGGAVAGGNVQDLRLRALKELAGPLVKNLGTAVADVYRAKRAGDERSMWAIFSDSYGDLNAKARGALQEHVNNQYAEILSRDLEAPRKLSEFQDAIEASGGPGRASYSLAQKATTPYLVKEVEEQIPRTRIEAETRALAERDQQRDISARFKGVFRRSGAPKAEDVADSLDEVRRETNLKIRALDNVAQDERASLQNWDLPEQPSSFDKGADLRALAQQELELARPIAQKKYADALDLADSSGVAIKPAAIRREGQSILKTTLSQIDPDSAPESIRRLVQMITPNRAIEGQITQLLEQARGAHGPERLRLNNEISALRRRAQEASDKPFRLRDINEVMIKLNDDISAVRASGAADALLKSRNLQHIKGVVEEAVLTQVPADVRQLYEAAQGHYATEFAPRFKEGSNALIRRDAPSSRPGEPRVRNEKIFEEWSGETGMKQFDTLFGGNEARSIPRNTKAYDLLGESLENTYNKAVLEKGKLTRGKHDAWMQSKNAELERLPTVREKLDTTANKLLDIDALKAEQAAKFEDVLKMPLSRAIGYAEAKAVMARALSDPRQMNRLIDYSRETMGSDKGPKSMVRYVMEAANPFTNGEYDPRKLMALTDAGKAGSDGVSSLQTLFREANGKVKGDEQFRNLMAIGLLAERQGSTNPKFFRPMQSTDVDFIRESTGSSGASWISYFNNWAQGRISGPYAGGVVAGRYMNLELSKAMREMQNKALFDPVASAHVLELMNSPENRALSKRGKQAVNYLAGQMPSAGGLFKRLVGADDIPAITVQSARIGATESTKDD